MFIIVSYDVHADRTEIFKKICQLYLIHIQNSVFRGNLNKSQIMELEYLLKKSLKSDEIVYVWKIMDSQIFHELKFGEQKYKSDNFLE
jgi:CRISPR-associated endonuclease Cas2